MDSFEGGDSLALGLGGSCLEAEPVRYRWHAAIQTLGADNLLVMEHQSGRADEEGSCGCGYYFDCNAAGLSCHDRSIHCFLVLSRKWLVEETRLVDGMQDGFDLRRKMGRFDVGTPSLLDYGDNVVVSTWTPGLIDHTRGALLSRPKSRISTSGTLPALLFLGCD